MCCQGVRVQIVALSSLWYQIFVWAGIFSAMMYRITPGDKFEFTVELTIVCRILSGIKTSTPMVLVVMHSGITREGVNGIAHP